MPGLASEKPAEHLCEKGHASHVAAYNYRRLASQTMVLYCDICWCSFSSSRTGTDYNTKHHNWSLWFCTQQTTSKIMSSNAKMLQFLKQTVCLPNKGWNKWVIDIIHLQTLSSTQYVNNRNREHRTFLYYFRFIQHNKLLLVKTSERLQSLLLTPDTTVAAWEGKDCKGCNHSIK